MAAGTAQTDAANVSQLISSGSYDNDTKKLTLSSKSGNDVIVDLSALSGDNPDVDEPVDLSKNDKTARVVDGFNTKVVANKVTEDKENNLEITEYQVNVEGNGAAEEGNTGLISGDTLYNELKDKADITYIDAELANKADTDLGNITDDGKGVIGNIAEEALADYLNAKANADASNVADHTAEWGAAIGTGVVEDGNGELVTGGTVYNAVKGKADITYVDNELLTKADVDLSNITEGGQTVIQNIAKGSIKLENGTNTTVSSTENADGSISYQVNVEGNGKAEAGNTGLINGDTLYNTINENITNVTEGINTELDGKANADASNVADHTAEWGEAIGTGKVETGNGELVTGDTVYEAVKDKADKDYVDEQLSGKADADLGNLTDEGKYVIKDIAKDTVKVEDGLNTTVSSTENADGSINYQVNVEGNGKVEAGNTGLINGDTLYNTVNEINENITNVTEGINAELDGKANADASNVADHTAEWGAAIGTGKVEAGNGELVTGDTVYNAVKDKVDADFGNITEEGKDVIGDIAQEALQDDLDGKANIDASNIETDKWADKLGTGTITAGDTNLVTGDTVYDAIKDLGSNSLVTSDGNTISVGKNDSGTVIDVSKHNGDGSTENRVITGVATDANDMSSAANVGYVNQSVGQLATDLNRGLSELDSRMKKGVAGAAALAALNPLDYDPENKLNFAAGVGSYKGESATALGMFYRPNENVMFSLGASIGNGENMWNAGITFNLDKPSASTSKAAMARAIKTMAAENDALEAKTAEQDAKIALLTEQVEALLATQEK
ncbi:MAG TPA: YadA C-terminal domain-containing protein [Candidatus Fusicatenibacter intestinipullorum]|nr:YadA C-terminal domain-containing protein [Candidatus Fusicatenibacter intestinipullorum]